MMIYFIRLKILKILDQLAILILMIYNIQRRRIRRQIAKWAIDNNIPLSKVSSLLKIMKQHKHLEQLPSDARTLLKTMTSTNIKPIGNNGSYAYIGITNHLKRIINDNAFLGKADCIELLTNVDEAPVTKNLAQK
jgi:hypothetical protein